MKHLKKTKRWVWGGILAGLLFGPGTYEMARLSLAQHRLDKQLGLLAAKRKQLEQEEERLKSDDAYVEGLIRSTFKVSRPGELVIPIDDSSAGQARPLSKNQ